MFMLKEVELTPKPDENGDKPAEAGDAVSPGNAPGCGPECACVKPAGNKKLRIAVCLAVIVAVCGILLYKATSARQNDAGTWNAGFCTPLAEVAPGAAANRSRQQAEIGTPLPSISALNTVAAKLDSVFVIVPGKDNAPPTKEAVAALAAAERTLHAKGIRTGVYTLQTGSPDYPDLAVRVSAPGIAVLTKGRGIGVVSGNISETNLMQSYVASTRGGGCCPPGGGAAAAPCK
jgi:hypothetical protein